MLALLLFLGLPILEIMLFIQAGSAFGFWPTVAAVFGTAILGVLMVRHQGIATLRAAEKERAEGKVPVAAMLHGVRIAVAGMLLILPGFITDAFGLLLLIPGMAQGIAKVTGASGDFRFGGHYQARYGSTRQGETIDGDYEVVVEPDPPATNRKPEGETIIALPDSSKPDTSKSDTPPADASDPEPTGTNPWAGRGGDGQRRND